MNGWIVLGIAGLMFLSGWALGFAFGMSAQYGEDSNHD